MLDNQFPGGFVGHPKAAPQLSEGVPASVLSESRFGIDDRHVHNGPPRLGRRRLSSDQSRTLIRTPRAVPERPRSRSFDQGDRSEPPVLHLFRTIEATTPAPHDQMSIDQNSDRRFLNNRHRIAGNDASTSSEHVVLGTLRRLPRHQRSGGFPCGERSWSVPRPLSLGLPSRFWKGPYCGPWRHQRMSEGSIAHLPARRRWSWTPTCESPGRSTRPRLSVCSAGRES